MTLELLATRPDDGAKLFRDDNGLGVVTLRGRTYAARGISSILARGGWVDADLTDDVIITEAGAQGNNQYEKDHGQAKGYEAHPREKAETLAIVSPPSSQAKFDDKPAEAKQWQDLYKAGKITAAYAYSEQLTGVKGAHTPYDNAQVVEARAHGGTKSTTHLIPPKSPVAPEGLRARAADIRARGVEALKASDLPGDPEDHAKFLDELASLAEKGQLNRGQLGSKIAAHLYAMTATVPTDHIADIWLGLPAAGKSSAMRALPPGFNQVSRILSADQAKLFLPEFGTGEGAGAVHEESSNIKRDVETIAIAKGENISMTSVGDDPTSIARRIERLKPLGYDVRLHYIDTPSNVSARRTVDRMAETGRLVDPEFILKLGDEPGRKVYNESRGNTDGYEVWHWNGSQLELAEAGGTLARDPAVREAGRRWDTANAAGRPSPEPGASAGSGAGPVPGTEHHGKLDPAAKAAWLIDEGGAPAHGPSKSNRWAGNCYQAAWTTLANAAPPGSVLVHGTPKLNHPGDQNMGKRFGHAWVETPDGWVIDRTAGKGGTVIDRDLYYAIGHIHDDDIQARFTKKQAYAIAFGIAGKRGATYGPWTDTAKDVVFGEGPGFTVKPGIKKIIDKVMSDKLTESNPEGYNQYKHNPFPADDWTPSLSKHPVATHTFEGGFYKDLSGIEWYVKDASSVKQLQAEMLTNELYRRVGVKVPDAKLVTMGGKTRLATRRINGEIKDTPIGLAKHPDIHAGFAADAWLANWDVAGTGHSNLIRSVAGNVYRIDHGGALDYRAQGSPKKFEGVFPTEITSLLDPSVNERTAKIFSSLTNADIIKGIQEIAKVPTSEIHQLAEKSGFTPVEASHYADVLNKRRDEMIGWAMTLDPAGAAGELKPMFMPVAHQTTPLHGDSALHSVGPKTAGQHAHDATGAAHWFASTDPGEMIPHVHDGVVDPGIADMMNHGNGVGGGSLTHMLDGSTSVPHYHNAASKASGGTAHYHESITGAAKTGSPVLPSFMTQVAKAQAAQVPSSVTVHAGFTDFGLNPSSGGGSYSYNSDGEKWWQAGHKAWLASLPQTTVVVKKKSKYHYGGPSTKVETLGQSGANNYTGSGYMNYNEHFRKGGTYATAPKGAKDFIKAIIAGPGLPEDMILYRGAHGNYGTKLRGLKVGDEETELAFMSTAFDAQTPLHGIGSASHTGSGVLLRLKVPKDYPVGYGSSGEHEVILRPHVKFRIDSIHPNYSSGIQGAPYVIEATVLEPTLAEYMDPKNKDNQALLQMKRYKTYPKCPFCPKTDKAGYHVLNIPQHAIKQHLETTTVKAKGSFSKHPIKTVDDTLTEWYRKDIGAEPHEHEEKVWIQATGTYGTPDYVKSHYEQRTTPPHIHDQAADLTYTPGQGFTSKPTGYDSKVHRFESLSTPMTYHTHAITHDHDQLGEHTHAKLNKLTAVGYVYHKHAPNGDMESVS